MAASKQTQRHDWAITWPEDRGEVPCGGSRGTFECGLVAPHARQVWAKTVQSLSPRLPAPPGPSPWVMWKLPTYALSRRRLTAFSLSSRCVRLRNSVAIQAASLLYDWQALQQEQRKASLRTRLRQIRVGRLNLVQISFSLFLLLDFVISFTLELFDRSSPDTLQHSGMSLPNRYSLVISYV